MFVDDTVDLLDHVQMNLSEGCEGIDAVDQMLVFRGIKLSEKRSRHGGVRIEKVLESFDTSFSFDEGVDSRDREDGEIVRHERGLSKEDGHGKS